ncbi:MAG: phosphatase PAP2 family protein [Verrucomicrobiaceae bacterium]|nr:phosphatase PAP2 family protein [Verrucomicrobiaceae bacterium]
MTALDQAVFWRINRDWSNPVLDYLMPALSAIEAWLPLLIVALLILAWKGSQKLRWMLLCLGLALGLGDGVIGNGLKKALGRVRPRDSMSGVITRDLADVKPRTLALFKPPVIKITDIRKPHLVGKSIPSNHTVNLFAATFVVIAFYRRWGAFVFILATLVAYSRVYVGAHWPGDIIPSIGLGLFAGWCGLAIGQKLQKWQQNRIPRD